jgi:hypothetical protein
MTSHIKNKVWAVQMTFDAFIMGDRLVWILSYEIFLELHFPGFEIRGAVRKQICRTPGTMISARIIYNNITHWSQASFAYYINHPVFLVSTA